MFIDDPRMCLLLTLGIGAPMLGLVGLLACPGRTWQGLKLSLVGILLGLGLVAVSLRAHPELWLPLVGLSIVAAGLWLEPLRAGLAWLTLQSRKLQLAPALLVFAGPLLAWALMPAIPPLEDAAEWTTPPTLHEITSCSVATDAGRSIPVYLPTWDKPVRSTMEAEMVALLGGADRVIRLDCPPTSNCHGLVFAGGRFWIENADVELILRDNGYALTHEPQHGDMAVYRDPRGDIVHSGLVVRTGDGALLIDSKWGSLGRYLHAPHLQFGGPSTLSFYRSPRGNHLLQGMQVALVHGR